MRLSNDSDDASARNGPRSDEPSRRGRSATRNLPDARRYRNPADPIQYRNQLGQSVALVAYQECIEVLVVMVSVAMVAGDTTQDGVDTVRAQLAGADSQYLADTCDEPLPGLAVSSQSRPGI